MKRPKTSIELTEEQAAIKAFRRQRFEQLIGNEVCSECGGSGLDGNDWTCGTCDGFGVVYSARK